MASDTAIPLYYGLPNRPYKVLGMLLVAEPVQDDKAVKVAALEAKRHGADAACVFESKLAALEGPLMSSTTMNGKKATTTFSQDIVKIAKMRVLVIKYHKILLIKMHIANVDHETAKLRMLKDYALL